MIGERQPEMELLEAVAFIYPFLLKAGSQIPSAARILQHSFSGCIVQL